MPASLTLSQFQLLEADVMLSLSIRGRNCHDRRLRFLACRGWEFGCHAVEYNFGVSGTLKRRGYIDGRLRGLLQPSCAIGCRANNGYMFNRCDVHEIIALSQHNTSFLPSQF